MLFHKSLVSLVAAIALASSVTASATPLRRTDPHPVSPSECTASNDHLTCCDSTSSFSSQSGLIKTLLQALVLDLDLDLLVGANCLITGTVAWYCTLRLSYSIRWLNAPQRYSTINLLRRCPEPESVSFLSTAMGAC